MRRISWALPLAGLLVGLLAGCGDEGGGDQAPDAGATTPEPALVQTIVLTSAGGKVDPKAYFVDEPKQVKAYVKTFEDRDDVQAAVQQAVIDAGDREGRLAVATIAIGCDVPEGVTITEGNDSVLVTPDKIADPKPECFAPTTSIALVEVP